MIRVAIVDDEYLVRERVKKCIDWNSLGFAIVGEASNGQDALLLIRDTSPQIVITDILMPHVDGIGLAEHLKSNFPMVKVVIFTGYRRFDYARDALNAGAIHYLLKPINTEELIQILESLRLQIEREKQVEQFTKSMNIEASKDFERRKTKLFKQLISGRAAHQIKANSAPFPPGLIDKDLMIVLIEICGKLNAWLQSEDLELWRFAITNIFDEIFDNVPHSICFDGHENRVVLIVSADKNSAVPVCERMCGQAQDYILQYLQIRLTICISNVHQGVTGFPKAYGEAQDAMRNKLILGSGRIIRYDMLKTAAGRVGVDENIRSALLISMRLCDRKTIREEIDGIFEAVLKTGMTYDDFQLILSEILSAIVSFAHEKELELPVVAGRPLTVTFLTDGIMDIHDIKECLFEAIRDMIQKYERKNLLGYSNLILKTKKYIEANYANKNISLETIAANMCISSSYLSSLFKKESKYSIVEYLTHCRMNNAKKLLDEGGKTLAELADKVGFTDPYYFSKCFKKHFGVSPSQYKSDNK